MAGQGNKNLKRNVRPAEPSLLEKVTVISNENKSTNVSLLGGTVRVLYWESILGDTVSSSVVFTDSGNTMTTKKSGQGSGIRKKKVSAVEGLPITGGEQVRLKFTDNNGNTVNFCTNDNNLYINSITPIPTKSQTTGKSYELILTSKEFIDNEKARVRKCLSGQISDEVESILKDILKTEKDLDIEETKDPLQYIGNNKKPFYVINNLSTKAVSAKDQELGVSAGKIFWETSEGYKFKSIESLLKQEPFTDQPFEMSQASTSSRFAILDAVMVQTNDIFLNMRSGTYNNDTTYIDLISQTKSVDDFKIDNLKDLKNPLKLPDNLTDSTSRKMLRFDDPGVMQKGSKREEEQPKEELAKIQNQSYARNNLLFSQALKIKVSFNPSLRVGKIIEVRLPVDTDSSESGVKYQKLGKGDLSGKYLISELRHKVGSNKSSTHLTLVRDLFTKDNA